MANSAKIGLCLILPCVLLVTGVESFSEAAFKEYDTNGDGQLDRAEIVVTQAGPGASDPKWQGGGMPIGEYEKEFRELWRNEIRKLNWDQDGGTLDKEVAAADKNADGKIDFPEDEELRFKMLLKLFDANGDGRLSPAETAEIH